MTAKERIEEILQDWEVLYAPKPAYKLEKFIDIGKIPNKETFIEVVLDELGKMLPSEEEIQKCNNKS